jgi:heterogeneous nuclear ribonucleoprotein A1/A3
MKAKIFVGNLPWSIRDLELKEAFMQYGEIIECAVIMERETGRSRGYAFITYKEEAAATAAIAAMNGVDFEGRQINVNESVSRRQPTFDKIGKVA